LAWRSTAGEAAWTGERAEAFVAAAKVKFRLWGQGRNEETKFHRKRQADWKIVAGTRQSLTSRNFKI